MTKDITIGCDPEFVTLDDGEAVNEGYDDDRGNEYIGWDGDLREIRPMYSTDPLKVVYNIKKCMELGAAREPDLLDLSWKAGSYHSDVGALGGHIHFGARIPTSYLDRFLAPVVCAIESKDEGESRRSEGYGRLGAASTQDWGIEYRTPGSWLTSPKVAKGVLCLAKVVGQAYVDKSLKILGQPICLTQTDIEVFDIDKIRAAALSIEATIAALPLYKKYASHIKFLYKLIRDHKSWFPGGMDMKASWALKIPEISNKYSFTA